MRAAMALAALLPIILSVSAAPTGPLPSAPLELTGDAGWTVEPVAFHGGSAPPDLAVDSAGIPHVLYCPPGDARFASRTVSGWTSEHLVATPFGGICGNLALGPDDVPHVTTPYSLDLGCVAYGVRTGGGWDFSCFPGGVLDAVDSSGRPHAVTYWTVAPDRFDLRHLWREADGTWQFEAAEPNALTAFPSLRWYSMVLDSADDPHVLYYDSVRGDVRYAFRDDAGWHVEVVEHVGNIGTSGQQGSLALDSFGEPHVAYFVRTDDPYGEVRYAVRTGTGWSREVVSAVQSFAPSLALGPDGTPRIAFQRLTWIDRSQVIYGLDQLYATRAASGWSEETVLDGFWDNTIPRGQVPQFPDIEADRCGNPHLAFYVSWWEGLDGSRSGVYYATKGEPCETRRVRLDFDPDTLNLRSRGKWVTAYLVAEDASTADVDPQSLRLNGIAPAWARTSDGTLVAKFDRAAFAGTVQPGEEVLVTLTGRWKDGSPFTATATIRVIHTGG